MKIVFDMEDTLVNLLDRWLEYLNSYKNIIHKTRDEIKDWDMKKAYPELTTEQICNPLFLESLWDTVEPVKGAQELIDKLSKDGHTLYIATASHPRTFAMKLEKCLFKHFKQFHTKNVMCIYDKHLIKCDFLIDDNPENLRNSHAIKILIDAPYNRDCDKDCYDYRVSNYEEIYDIINKIDNARSELYE